METQSTNSKIMTACFLLVAILIGVFVSVLVDTAAAVATGGLGRFLAQDLVHHGVPVLLGFMTFLVFQFNKTILTWADEVVTEIRRVVWPSRKETAALTVLVCVMLIICGLALGFYDVVSGTIVDWLLHQNFLGIFA